MVHSDFKAKLNKASAGFERQTIHDANFMFTYRNTPHTVTPALMFLKRRPRTRLALLCLNMAETVEKQQRNQKVPQFS